MGAELFHADRQTDGRTDVMLMIAFPSFGKAHKTTTTTITLAQKGTVLYIFERKGSLSCSIQVPAI
jgi:hypothetical protein